MPEILSAAFCETFMLSGDRLGTWALQGSDLGQEYVVRGLCCAIGRPAQFRRDFHRVGFGFGLEYCHWVSPRYRRGFPRHSKMRRAGISNNESNRLTSAEYRGDFNHLGMLSG